MNSIKSHIGVCMLLFVLANSVVARSLPGLELPEILPEYFSDLQSIDQQSLEDPIERARELLAAGAFLPVHQYFTNQQRSEPSMLRVRRVPGSEFLGKRSGYNSKSLLQRLPVLEAMAGSSRMHLAKRVPGSEFLGK